MGGVNQCKRAQFNFVWLFAILAGSAILFLAIYGAVKSGETQQRVTDTTAAKSLAILTDPLQSGFSDGSYGVISFSEETRLDVSCLEGGLGSMRLATATKSGPRDEWSRGGVDVLVPNKYLFSEESLVAKRLVVFSKPFKFPYKIADMVFLIPQEHCFIDVPPAIEEGLKRLNPPNIEVGTCNASDSIRVCFRGGSECDVKVTCSGADCSTGVVEKYGERVGFIDDLLYGAIFSDKSVYECNVQRLTYRGAKLAEGLMEKIDLLSARDCASNLKPELFVWSNRLANATSQALPGLKALSEELNRKNKVTRCKAWQ